MGTPHISAEKGDFAKIVLMPGDPRRATWIAETFLKDVKLVNDTRGALAYTGYTKNGKRISVMASGMGLPSIGIYSHELYNEFGVEAIIRIGTMGAYQENIKLRDVVIAMGSCTDSNLPGFEGAFSAIADYDCIEALVNSTKEKGLPLHVGNILSSNFFYTYVKDSWKKWADMNCLGVEMESYALYVNAALARKKAACICTISDSFVASGILTPQERQEGLVDMVEIAIASCEKLIDKYNWND